MSADVLNPDGSVDVIATLAAALPEAREVTKTQAALAAITAEKWDELQSHSTLRAIAKAVDAGRKFVDKAKEPVDAVLPEPIQAVVDAFILGVDGVDEVLKALRLVDGS